MRLFAKLSCFVALVSLPVLAGACADKAPSTITVALSSEAPLPDGVSSVSILVKRGGVTHLDQRYFASEAEAKKDPSVDATKALYLKDIPGTLALVDDEKSSGPVTVRVEADVLTGGGVVRRTIRSANASFVAEKQKLLRMPIQLSCSDVKCADGQSCRAGRCLSEVVPEADLEDFAEEKALPVDGKCFQRDECQAERIGIETVVDVFDEKTCTVPYILPGIFDGDETRASKTDAELTAERASINMGYIWGGAYNPRNSGVPLVKAQWTVVDQDSIEGWQFANVFYADPSRVLPAGTDLNRKAVLTEGLCDVLRKDKADILKAREQASKDGVKYETPPTRILGTVEQRGCASKPRQVPECKINQPGLDAQKK